ncbi:16S rRNA (cytidine(1402)-2'-O)-methyltransferase, partial [Adlercreutzia sp. ZJ305]
MGADVGERASRPADAGAPRTADAGMPRTAGGSRAAGASDAQVAAGAGDLGAAGASDARGRLVIVPTPIGNLGDMTARALDALRAADVVCAEDTRVTGRLLAAFGIEKRLERLDEALIGVRAAGVAERVCAGEVIAYCSDAGMPGVSDPGMRLVAAARAAGAPVEVLPGPSAAATAYVASGCANTSYFFGGFFPRKAAEQRARLESLRALDAALVFYESPNRLVGALKAVAEAFPLREVTVCRELTKLHEEVLRGLAGAVRDAFAARAGEPGGIRGEIVLVIDGPNAREAAAAAA